MRENLNNGNLTQIEQKGDRRLNKTHIPAFETAEYHFGDIVNARNHTQDFMVNRAEYITVRLRFMAIVFAVIVPAYILVDYFTLTDEHFQPIVILRCILSLIHVTVILITFRKLSILGTYILLGVDILAVVLFSVSSLYVLQSGVSEVPPTGYALMPFMIIVMLSLFPLTLLYSFLNMTLLVVGPHIGLQIWLGQLVTQEALDMFILLLLFMGIVMWLQSSQLLMLLKLYRQSTRDVLTGLFNRRVLMKFLDGEVDKNSKYGRHFSILMLDLDYFKHINDDYGHYTGDLVLKATARMLENEIRKDDIVARFGGEEFVVVLPGLKHDEALAIAKRICDSCSRLQITIPDGLDVTFTTSIGVSEYISGEKIETTLRRADEALYNAKEQGRNQVIYNPPAEPTC